MTTTLATISREVLGRPGLVLLLLLMLIQCGLHDGFAY
jgi:hypothetical protein